MVGRKLSRPRPSGPPARQRLQRVLASAGYGSRRACETLILEGRVEVDGKGITELGFQVDPKKAEICVDGAPIRMQKLVYFLLNKPPGVVTTSRDPQGRTRVLDLIQEQQRVFPVGRLDRSSEGLILLTNDGDLAQQLAHPRYGIQKVYRVTVAGKIDQETIDRMRQGIYIAEGRVSVDGAKILRHRARSTDLEILLREGKNREIRRILARLGHKVMSLERIAIGSLRLGELPRGAYRPVTPVELKRLREEIVAQSRRAKEEPRAPGAKVKTREDEMRGKTIPPQKSPVERPPVPLRKPKKLVESQTLGTVIGEVDPGQGASRAPRPPRPSQQAGAAQRKGVTAERKGVTAKRKGVTAQRKGVTAQRKGAERKEVTPRSAKPKAAGPPKRGAIVRGVEPRTFSRNPGKAGKGKRKGKGN